MSRTFKIKKSQVVQVLRQFADSKLVFSVVVARRGPLYLRYPSSDPLKNGSLAYVGDRCELRTRRWITAGRGGKKIILEPAGTYRKMVLKGKRPDPVTGIHTPTAHYIDRGGEHRIDLRKHNLFGPLFGMYPDTPRRQPNGEVREGRYGQWRPWSYVNLDAVKEITGQGMTYVVN